MEPGSATFTLAEVCNRLELEVPEGMDAPRLTGISTLELAQPTEVSFLARSQYRKQLESSQAPVILVDQRSKVEDPRALRVGDVWLAVISLIELFHPASKAERSIHPTAVIDHSVKMGENVHIGANTVIEEEVILGDNVWIGALSFVGKGTTIGNDCTLHERVTVSWGTEIGKRVILHPGVVLGADGFKYEIVQKRLTKIPQIGRVVIEDDVEIGANSAVDRASFAETRIGARTKIDNLVQIGHNVQIGSDCVIAGQVGIAGSTRLGRGVMVGGQTGIADNKTIGDGARIAAKTGVTNHVQPGSEVVGSPHMDSKLYLRIRAIEQRLPELYAKVKPLLDSLEEKSD